MDSFFKVKAGWIWFITGAMFAGKSSFLIKKIEELQNSGRKVLVFKPKKDNRFKKNNFIVTHDQKQLEAITLKTPKELQEIVEQNSEIEFLAFDEVHFLKQGFFPIIKKLAQGGKKILCSGLKKDYWNQYVSAASKILVEADKISFFFSKCHVCKSEFATRTQRLNKGKPVSFSNPRILVGGESLYEARCNDCVVVFD